MNTPDKLYDLAIIGGGINGAAIARDAALRGLRTILLEQFDFGCGASAKTSKLIHGGLRYLRNFEFGLVRSCVEERAILLKNAPHLVKPLPFLFPVYVGDPTPFWQLKCGLWIYDFMRPGDEVPGHQNLTPTVVHELFPTLKSDNMTGAGLYYDALMNDSRLVIENILSAEKAGAMVLNYTPVLELTRSPISGKIDGVMTKGGKIAAITIVNATGAWSNHILELEPDLGKHAVHVAPTKGVHLIVPFINREHALILTAPQDGRIFFIIPWNGYSLIGTTDTFYKGNPSDVKVEPEDITYLLTAANHYLSGQPLTEECVIASYAGLRPLVASKAATPSKASRDYVIHTSPGGLVTLLGGKYTTHRLIAEDVVDTVIKQQPKNPKLRPCRTKDLPLYGADNAQYAEALFKRQAPDLGLPDEQIEHLIRQYGSGCIAILDIIRANPADAKQICPLHPHVFAEITYAVQVEKARTLEDWLYRRTAIGYTSCGGKGCCSAAAKKFADLLPK